MDWEAINTEVVAFGKTIADAPQGPPVVISDSKTADVGRRGKVRDALAVNRHYAAKFADAGYYAEAAAIMMPVSSWWWLTLE